jgi:hypothetical protein
MPISFFSLLDMQKNLAPDIPLALPVYLPEGFFFRSGNMAQTTRADGADGGKFSFTYNRGQDEWITLTEQSRNSTVCPDGPEYRLMDAGKSMTRGSGSSELTWARYGWCLTLSGILPREELEKIAASVQPVPYQEGILPPFEYQPPAHPLTGNFTINRSATMHGITITVESLQCDPDACTAQVRLGVASPPAFTAPPEITVPPVSPEPHAEWRVDGGRPLLMMPGNGGYRPEGETTLTFWKIEPLPEGSRELTANFSRVKGISGSWMITIPLDQSSIQERNPPAGSEDSP